MRGSKPSLFALLFCLTWLLVPVTRAQEFRATIQGLVTDSSQAVVVGATVTLLNVKTNIQTVRQTNDAGRYRFDDVDPGSYTVTVQIAGFARFIQENIEAQARGDITVNVELKTGGVSETVTVTESPVAVQFNSTNVALTVDSKLVEELPRYDRNPFKLTLLNPAVQDTRRTEMNPFNSWAANSIEMGGGTDKKNDLLVDGSPIGSGYKASYVPNTDAVQEVNVQQNAVDAEAGHSAGGSVSMTTKSGTNEFHGSAFYLGRNPSLNAMTDRTTRTNTATRNNIFGGTIGHPIFKNKLFNFFSLEEWRQNVPSGVLATVPTALEKQGDFSQSLNTNGALRTIYDPYTTVLNAAGTVTRTPFVGNKIPSSRFDPLSLTVMKGFDGWAANRAPDNLTGLNNFAATAVAKWNYWNLSDRVDWFANDRWRIYGRYSIFKTAQDTFGDALLANPIYIPGGSARNARSYNGEAIFTPNATTVVNVRATKQGLDDDYHTYRTLGTDRFAAVWPNNPWYKPFDMTDFPTYFPGVYLGSTTGNSITGSNLGRPGFWYQHPGGYAFNGKVSHQRGSHFIKTGFEFRHSGGISLVNNGQWQFFFPAATTADTFLNPNTRLVGDEFATLLLGSLGPETVASTKPVRAMEVNLYGAYVQDDWKLNRRITLNLGLRYEYETPWRDPNNNASLGPDLTKPIAEMKATPPAMPAAALSLMKTPYVYNGSWVFTDSNNRGIWKAQKFVLMPRIGMAMRINDKTALRAGWARFVAPGELNFILPPYPALGNVSFLEAPYMGFDGVQGPPAFAAGVPQAKFSDPFPAATNPIIAPRGKGFGQYFGLGEDNIAWANQNFHRLVNDRLNVTISHQLPNQIVGEVTYFVNLGHNVAYARNLNQMDPQLGYVNKTALDVNVANPFYHYLSPDVFGGNLRNQATVPLKRLLVQYPQYGGLWETYKDDGKERYQALQIKVQRPFRGGYNFLVGYNYRRETSLQYYDEVASYQDQLTYQQSPNARHSMSIAGTYQLPFGKGKMFMGNAPRAVDSVLGGWQVIGAWYFNSGNYLKFGPALASGDPTLSSPTPGQWFDTSKIKVLPAYTQRTNPWFYPGLKGPTYWDIQSTLSKSLKITERFRAELKIAAYNLTNRLNRADPSTDPTNSAFGQSLRPYSGQTGRQMEYGLKIVF